MTITLSGRFQNDGLGAVEPAGPFMGAPPESTLVLKDLRRRHHPSTRGPERLALLGACHGRPKSGRTRPAELRCSDVGTSTSY